MWLRRIQCLPHLLHPEAATAEIQQGWQTVKSRMRPEIDDAQHFRNKEKEDEANISTIWK